jgi:hypothetical protein
MDSSRILVFICAICFIIILYLILLINIQTFDVMWLNFSHSKPNKACIFSFKSVFGFSFFSSSSNLAGVSPPSSVAHRSMDPRMAAARELDGVGAHITSGQQHLLLSLYTLLSSVTARWSVNLRMTTVWAVDDALLLPWVTGDWCAVSSVVKMWRHCSLSFFLFSKCNLWRVQTFSSVKRRARAFCTSHVCYSAHLRLFFT